LSPALLDSVWVEDPYGIAADPVFPSAGRLLDPAEMQSRLASELPRLAEGGSGLRLRVIRVLRHKPGRRFVIQYELESDLELKRSAVLIGKVRARKNPMKAYERLDAFWRTGFDDQSADGVSVPEPIGFLPDLGVWFQRRAPGTVATELLDRPGAEELMTRVARAACKIHRSGVPVNRIHTMGDEVRILRERLSVLAETWPHWALRIQRMLSASERLAASVPAPAAAAIHRDFYPDQVIVAGDRLYLIDFDLYCSGDAALDIGNFLGHLIEQALRTKGDPAGYAALEEVLAEGFYALAGPGVRSAVEAYRDLTLMRHIQLSTLLEDRRPLTPLLLELCEARLALWM
jgi:phosphotransferase family enzyme